LQEKAVMRQQEWNLAGDEQDEDIPEPERLFTRSSGDQILCAALCRCLSTMALFI
jgi:hypothetical protein